MAVRPVEREEEYAHEEAKGGETPPSPPPSSHKHDSGEALFNRLQQAWRSPQSSSSSSRRTRHAGAVPYTPPHSPSSAGRSSVPTHTGRSAGAPSPPVGQLQSHLRSYSPTGAGMSPAAGGRRRRAQPSGFREQQRADIVPGGKVKGAAWGELVGGRHVGYETAASGVPGACERLYAEAVALRRRREEAVARQAYLEQKERVRLLTFALVGLVEARAEQDALPALVDATR